MNDKERILYAANSPIEAVFSLLNTSEKGIEASSVEQRQEIYGVNDLATHHNESKVKQFFKVFLDPFTGILVFIVFISLFTDIVLTKQKDYSTVIIVSCIILLSGVLRFIQESRSGDAAEKLKKMIVTTTSVARDGQAQDEFPLTNVVVGDIIHLSAGDIIPADLRIFKAKDLFMSESTLTGESEPVEKHGDAITESTDILHYKNLAFMGTSVVSGSCVGVVVRVGKATEFGNISTQLNEKVAPTSFDKGVASVSWLLIRFMLVMVPIVFVINAITKQDWLSVFLFSLSIAIGLTPQMMPMIITTCLAKGAVAMSKKKTIIKRLNSIQNLGAIDILCTDKTGTLTQDKVVLQFHLDVFGNQSDEVLEYAYLNSSYQTGLKNLMDKAIIDEFKKEIQNHETVASTHTYVKEDEIPFDFQRRRMSIVVKDETGKRALITKGALEEILEICTKVSVNGEEIPFDQIHYDEVLERTNLLNNQGMRVLGLAYKPEPKDVASFDVKDESQMVLLGFLAFLDPPKDSAKEAIAALKEVGVRVKILTGDNELVTKFICGEVGLPCEKIMTGNDVEAMSNTDLSQCLKDVDVFAKLSPAQKERIIKQLREKGHTVGYLGDGINDTGAIRNADIGISVDTAVDVAKETAHVILLEKNLLVLRDGILEGRKTYANMIKYMKITVSSNFGNMFSVLVASAFLPFLPMAAIHLILLALVYDFSCTAIPWDNVDAEFIEKPKKWDAANIGKFMVWFGPTSSVFDITTFVIMYFVICPMFTEGILFHQLTSPSQQLLYVAVFQTGWFIESMWTQTLVIHMIRTPKIPFIQSRASLQVLIANALAMLVITVIPYTVFGTDLGLHALPLVYYVYLFATIFAYMLLITFVKKIYISKYHTLL